MEKVLITGSNGFLGSHLIDWVINKNFQIYALDKPQSSFRNLIHYTDGKQKYLDIDKNEFVGENIQILSNNEKLTFIECDIRNTILLEKILSFIKPKYIFHFGAQPYVVPSWENPINTIEINVIGTLNLFEPLKKHKINTRVIIACTAAEFGTTTNINRPLKETDPLMAVHPYGISKIATELLARQYYLNFGIEIINLRFFNLTGIRRINDASSDFIRKLAKIELGFEEPIIEVGNLQPYRDYLNVKDAIQAIWLSAIKGRPGETYHVCSNRKIQIRELLNSVLSFSSKNIIVKEKVSNKLRKFDEDVIIGDNTKIKKELKWKVNYSIDQTLKEMFEYWIDYYTNYPSYP